MAGSFDEAEFRSRSDANRTMAVPFAGTCYRSVRPKFASAAKFLSPDGSVFTGGRYNHRGTLALLYLSCDTHTCVEEVTKSFSRSGLVAAQSLPRMIIAVDVHLSRVLDLTSALTRRTIGVTKALLTETDWEHEQEVLKREAATQVIGRVARDLGFEAILAPSAVFTGTNLNIFTDRLDASSRLELINPDQL